MNRHQNSERHHTTNKTNSFHFEDAYVNLAYENNSDSPDDTQQNSDDPQMNKIQEMGSVLTNNGKHKIHCLTIIGQTDSRSMYCRRYSPFTHWTSRAKTGL